MSVRQGSTEPFSDPERGYMLQEPKEDQDRDEDETLLPISQLTQAMERASLEMPPSARLILGYIHGKDDEQQQQPLQGIVRLSHGTSDGWDVVGVLQRTRDVRFTFRLPLTSLEASVYYNPDDDDCVFLNHSGFVVLLAPIGPCHDLARPRRLESRGLGVITPGIWSVSLEKPQQHFLNLIILRRTLDIAARHPPARPAPSGTIKRKADNYGNSSKRRRRQDDTDVTEVILAPYMRPPPRDSTPELPRPLAPTGARPWIALRNLSEGNIMVVRQESSADSSLPGEATTYQLHRLQHIARTTSASVFVAKHSLLPKQIVVKIMTYDSGNPILDLVHRAKVWEREHRFLEKLKHPNIVSMEGFDSRLLVLYLEILPDSLQRQDRSRLTPHDKRIILQDIASALSYLESEGISHNDVKPANIAYSRLRGGVLLDFGVATKQNPHANGGTPWYVPPEYLVERCRGHPGDVWALGVAMLYVLGKIGLPETSHKEWLIREVGSILKADEVMLTWLGIVRKVRAELDGADAVEGAVFKMLDPQPKTRIKAREIYN